MRGYTPISTGGINIRLPSQCERRDRSSSDWHVICRTIAPSWGLTEIGFNMLSSQNLSPLEIRLFSRAHNTLCIKQGVLVLQLEMVRVTRAGSGAGTDSPLCTFLHPSSSLTTVNRAGPFPDFRQHSRLYSSHCPWILLLHHQSHVFSNQARRRRRRWDRTTRKAYYRRPPQFSIPSLFQGNSSPHIQYFF